jgi:hypothetical protein
VRTGVKRDLLQKQKRLTKEQKRPTVMGMIPEVFLIEDVDDSFAIHLAFAIEFRRLSINIWCTYNTYMVYI